MLNKFTEKNLRGQLVSVPERIHKIIELLGFTRVFQIYSTEEEALVSFTNS